MATCFGLALLTGLLRPLSSPQSSVADAGPTDSLPKIVFLGGHSLHTRLCTAAPDIACVQACLYTCLRTCLWQRRVAMPTHMQSMATSGSHAYTHTVYPRLSVPCLYTVQLDVAHAQVHIRLYAHVCTDLHMRVYARYFCLRTGMSYACLYSSSAIKVVMVYVVTAYIVLAWTRLRPSK